MFKQALKDFLTQPKTRASDILPKPKTKVDYQAYAKQGLKEDRLRIEYYQGLEREAVQ
jgi:hypothetical protein